MKTEIFLAILFMAIISQAQVRSECGRTGDIERRIESCGDTKCFVSKPNLGAIPVPCKDQHNIEWALITKTANHNELWLDRQTQLLWSDDSLVVAGTQATLQSYCENPQLGNDVKGGMSVDFELPTADQYRAAEKNGIRQVLRSIEALVFWTSSAFGPTEAWFFEDGEVRHMNKNSNDEYFRAHCIARTNL